MIHFFYSFFLFFCFVSSTFVLPYDSFRILTGNFRPANADGFVRVPLIYGNKQNLYLQKEVLKKFQRMRRLATKEGVELYICSATRNYQIQKQIWEAKFLGYQTVNGINLAEKVNSHKKRAEMILHFSSMPGTSRHHWGSDIDIIPSLSSSLTNATFERGRGLKLYRWLRKHAVRFGFCQPYRLKPFKRNGQKFTSGYQEEKWHWSYKPLALKYFKQYKKHMDHLKPKGFLGSQAAGNLYRDYVLNVHPECL